jgi:3D (Asp-Asp-Asp) domain-containing protein
MYRIISRSQRRKVVVLFFAILGFVLLYETRILDSERYSWIFGGNNPPTPGTRLQFSATAYCKGSTTASGVRVRTGVAAADPALLPVGSVVSIGTGDLKYNGVYTVMDTGPEVKGRELDLYIWSCHEALRFGRKPVQVTVLRLGWDPQASSPTLIDRLFRRRESTRRAPAAQPPPPAGVRANDPPPQETEEAGTRGQESAGSIPVPLVAIAP